MVLYAYLIGLLLGSFINVCIHRIPRGESIAFPPSRCPHCKARLRPTDLIPVVSFLLLKGRCRYCGGGINPRYPAVELLTALLFAIVYLKTGLSILLLKYLFFTVVLVIVTFIDLEYYIIPNKLVAFAFVAGILINIITRDLSLARMSVGIVSASSFFIILYAVSGGGMGGGDIKFAAVIGLFLGWPLALLASFLACFLAGIAGILLIVTKIKTRKDIIPFGPFLAAGTFITMLWGNQLIAWYLQQIIG